MNRALWVETFIDEVIRAEIGFNDYRPVFLRTTALSLWTESDRDPRAAARKWIATRRPEPRVARATRPRS